MRLKVFKNRQDWPISGLKLLGKDVPVELNFTAELLGHAELYKDGDFIYANIKFLEGVDMASVQLLTPSLRVEVRNLDIITTVHSGEVVGLGLCSNPNIDDAIKPILLQFEEQVYQMQEKEGTVHFTSRTQRSIPDIIAYYDWAKPEK